MELFLDHVSTCEIVCYLVQHCYMYGTAKKKRPGYLVGNLVATNWPIEKALHAIGYNQIPTIAQLVRAFLFGCSVGMQFGIGLQERATAAAAPLTLLIHWMYCDSAALQNVLPVSVQPQAFIFD